MKWFQDNPLGMVLAGVGGFFILLSLLLAIVWTRPVQVDLENAAGSEVSDGENAAIAHQLGPLKDYQVILEKPLFNVTRRLEIVEIDESEPVAEVAIEVKDPPKVKLTGVIITPGMKIATLTPENGDKDSVMAHEGESMTGEYVGWLVSSVEPRSVVLESRNGETLKLNLEVYDTKLKEPIRVDRVINNPASSDQPDELVTEDGQPIDRAEQIRQRIAERREELRREQEDKLAAEEAGEDANPRQGYQDTIRALMNKTQKDKDN